MELASEDLNGQSAMPQGNLDDQPATAPLKASCIPFLPLIPTALEPSHSSCIPYRLKRAADDPKTLNNARRKRKRAMKIAQNGHQPHPKTVQKVIQASNPETVPVNFADFPSAAGAYQAKISRLLAADIPHSAASLSTQGFEYLHWDGR